MTSTRRVVLASGVCAVTFLLLDAAWLTLMADRLYRPALGPLLREGFDPLAAALFYPLYIAGVIGFVLVPALASRHAVSALARGAAFGLVCYATYDLTNQATLLGWPWRVTVADLVWGSTVTGLSAFAGHVVATRFSNSNQ